MAIAAKSIVSVKDGCGVVISTSRLTICDGILCVGLSNDNLEPMGHIRKWFEIAGNRICVVLDDRAESWHLVGVSLQEFSELYFSSFEEADKEETADPDEDQWF